MRIAGSPRLRLFYKFVLLFYLYTFVNLSTFSYYIVIYEQFYKFVFVLYNHHSARVVFVATVVPSIPYIHSIRLFIH